MSDFVAQTPPGLTGGVYIESNDTVNSGVSVGDGCISNGTYVACAYRQSWNAIVVYNGDGNIVWGSGALLDDHCFSGLPIIEADGSVVAGDDHNLIGFNPDGSVAWTTPSPGGIPIGLVPTPNGAIVAATGAPQPLDICWQDNCTLAFSIDDGGSGYTTATVMLAGGDCPGAQASASMSHGSITSVTAITQGSGCEIPPDVLILGDGVGASVSASLTTSTPVVVYSAMNGGLIGSTSLYQTGNIGPVYNTINTPCVNNGSYPNRVYVLDALLNDDTQGALFALDIDPTNFTNPVTPAWSVAIHGPSGASPLCVGNDIYFDGAGIVPGDDVGTTIFGVQDNGTSGSFLFQIPMGAGYGKVTSNFALDPRPQGGFWHQIQYDPNIYHRNFTTGAVMESVNVSNLLVGLGAPQSTYWQGGIFTEYGTASQPYLMVPLVAHPAITGNPGYLAMLNLNTSQLTWAVPLAGNDTGGFDSPGGDAALVLNSNQNPVLVMSGKQTAAYFIASGGPNASFFPSQLTFGPQAIGATSSALTISLFNNASTTLGVGSIGASGPFTASNNCPGTLAPGIGCLITVNFTPTASGPLTGAVTILSSSQTGPLTVPLDGVGTAAAPTAVLSSTQLTFPLQSLGTISPLQQVTLQNIGAAGLAVASISATGAAAQTNNCPTDLAPGASCIVNVMLTAPLTGTCSGAVNVSTSAAGSPQTISVSGSCSAVPSIESSMSTSSLVFTPQTVGVVSPSQRVTYTNIGSLPLNVTSIVATGDANQTNTCGASLAVGANCTIAVSVTAAAAGPGTGTITVTDAAPDSPHAISTSGVGLPNPVAIVNQPLVPSALQPGTPGFSLTVNGTGFLPNSVVYWNGTPRVTQFISNSQVSAALTTADLANPCTGSVSVVNSGPGGGQSNTVFLPVGYPSFAPVVSTSTMQVSAGPSALAASDFNNDGNLDLAVTNSVANTVSIFLGNGNGTFVTNVDYATGNGPSAMALGDFNRDGITDLAVANQIDGTVSILLGAGGGAFGSQTVFAVGDSPSAIVAADLNGDGNLDLAVTNQADNTVSILFGNGDGTFAAQLAYPSGESPAALAVGDFNGDGKPDLAVGNRVTPGGTVTILLNHGDGSFLPGVPYPTDDSASLVVADFTGDGILDFAAANYLAQSLSVYTGVGNGTFKVGPTQTTRVSPNLQGLAAADVNADGSLELLVGGNADIGFTALENNNDATFLPILQEGIVSGTTALAVGDFNNDGSIDVVLAQPASNSIAVLLQTAAIALSSPALNFANVLVGGSGTQTVTITNSGSALLQIGSVNSSGSFSESNNCVAAIAPGNACAVTVTFSPTALGPQNGSLTISSNAFLGLQTVDLSGSGASFAVSIGLSGNVVIGGTKWSQNTVAVSSPAPAGGWMVTLSSSNPAVATVPASVNIAQAATVSSAFYVITAQVASPTQVAITASVNGASGTVNLTVNPLPASFNLAASSVYGGSALASNTLALASPAPSNGLIINLLSANPNLATVPASVTVAQGATVSSGFTINTVAVGSSTTVAIFAMSGANVPIADASLTLNPVPLGSVTLSPDTVTSGLSTTSNVVNLTQPAPPGGLIMSLSSSKPAVAAVPSSVTVPANATVSAPFTIATGYITTNTPVTITATLSGSTAAATLTVNPDAVASVNLSPASVVGGAASSDTGTVTLLSPAPSAGAAVKLSSSNSAVASVAASVKVAAGATVSPAFRITTTAVGVSTPVTIAATYNGIAAQATLTVMPVAPAALNLGQSSAIGGKVVSASVELNAAAPAGGVTVALSSSNSTVASAPASATVPAGARTAKFSVTTAAVTEQTTVTITADYQGTATAVLTVNP